MWRLQNFLKIPEKWPSILAIRREVNYFTAS